MPSLMDQVRQCFDRNGWLYETSPDPQVIQSGFEADSTRVHLHLQVFPPIHAVTVVSQSPLLQPDPDRRAKIAELLMRANQRLTLGGFEMRWDEGETLFRVSNLFSPGQLDPAILTMMVEATVVEMDHITPALHAIATSATSDLPGIDPENLLALVAGQDASS